MSYDQRNNRQVTKLKEEPFNHILDILIRIKKDINEPLNRADLIFQSKDEFDAAKAKAEIKKGLFNKG